MARPREFDTDQAVEDALQAFWRNGYESTSLPDLLGAMGLSRGSLYKAFGGKYRLYLTALRRYLTDARRDLSQSLENNPSARDAIREWLTMVAEMATRDGFRCGCFAVNSEVELGPHDEAVRALLNEHNHTLEEIVARTLHRGKASGEIGDNVVPNAVARTLRLLISGLQVGGKSTLRREEAIETVDTAMRMLD